MWKQILKAAENKSEAIRRNKSKKRGSGGGDIKRMEDAVHTEEKRKNSKLTAVKKRRKSGVPEERDEGLEVGVEE